MVWGSGLQQVLEGWKVVQHISLGLSCPFHCGTSSAPWFISGFALGLILGFALCFFLGFHLLFLLRPGFVHPPSTSEPSSAPSPSLLRLRAYVHEHSSRWASCLASDRCQTSACCGRPFLEGDWLGGETFFGCGGGLGIGWRGGSGAFFWILSPKPVHWGWIRSSWYPPYPVVHCISAVVSRTWVYCQGQTCFCLWILG